MLRKDHFEGRLLTQVYPDTAQSPPLRWWLPMTAGLIVLFLCLVGGRLAWESYEDHRDRHYQHSEETAAQQATALNEFLIGRVSVLEGIAASPAARHLNYDTVRDYLTSEQVERLGFTGGLALVDLDGGLRVDGLQRQPDPAPGAPATTSYADRAHFQEVIATGRPAIAPAIVGRISPQPLLSIAVPVFGDDGQMVAVLIGGSRLDDAGSVLSRHTSSSNGRLMIVDQAGQVLADDGPVGTLKDVSANPLLVTSRESPEGHASGITGVSGEPNRIVGFATVPVSGWTVFWEESQADVLGGARETLALQLLGLAFAGIATTMGAWAVGRRLDRQTRRERAAAALVAESEREARDFANRLPVLAWTRVVRDHRHDEIDFANSTMREFITGDPGGEFGPEFYDSGFDEELSRSLREDVVKTGAGGEVELRLRRHDGASRSHLLRVEPVLDERGAVIRLICTATDIEDLRQAQQQFQMALASVAAGERSFRDFADSIPVLAWRQVQRGDGLHMEFANARYREYETGHIGGEIAGALPHHPEDDQLIRESLERATADGTAAEIEARLRRWDGEYRWHLLRLVPIVDEAGVTEWIGGATDIQQLKETETALQEAIRAKDDFLGLVSHELRTPLQQVLGNADILLRRGKTFSKELQRESLHEIWVQGRRLQRLVENMLAISRLERGMRMEGEPHLAQRLLERTIAEFRERFPQTELRVDVEDEVPPVAVDPTAFDQVLWNLLTNAVKYGGGEGDPIDLTIGTEPGGWVAVAVHDRGPGLSDEEAERVFEPFVRSEKTQAAAGLGLGLSVCRRLMESQGGEMWARRREGGGMSFGFRLPPVEEDVEAEADAVGLTTATTA